MDTPSSPGLTRRAEHVVDEAEMLSPHRYAIFLGLIALAAVALRMWHIAWGLPGIYEEAYPFSKAWGFWNWGGAGVDLNPHFFNYPALTFYFHWCAQAIHYAVGHLFGLYGNLDAFRVAFETDPTRGIVIARSLNALFDTATIVALAMVARRLAGPTPSLIVSGLSAVNPLQVQMSQQVNVDVPMTFFLVIALWYMLRVYERGTLGTYVGAGVAIGLAAASKYTAATLIIPLLTVHLLREHGTRGLFRSLLDVRLFASVVLAEILFLALNPFMLLDTAAFKSGFGFELQHMAAGHFGIGEDSSSFWFYATQAIPANLGWVLGAFALGGLITVLRHREQVRRWAPVLTYLAILSALLVFWKMRADRYFLPLLPGIFLLISAALGEGMSLLRGHLPPLAAGHRKRLARSLVMLFATAALGGESVAAVLNYHLVAGKPDTRTIARGWIETHCTADAVVVMAPLGLPIPPPRTAFLLPYVAVDFQLLNAFYDARWYVDCDLVVGSDFDRARYLTEPEKFRSFLQFFYDSLDVRWRVAETFTPGGEYGGPRIWFYVPPVRVKGALFDESLLRRLNTFPDLAILVKFALNLTVVLERKGEFAKADQVWGYVTSRMMAQRDPVPLLQVFVLFPERTKALPRMQDLIQQLAWKAAKELNSGEGR
jgi:4-amino-4-deoxy-L-arabinose transferase-like glycosyltransferase